MCSSDLQAAVYGLYVAAAMGIGGVPLLWLATVAEGVIGTMATVALYSLMMDSADPAHPGTDYTLMGSVGVSLATLGGIAGGLFASFQGFVSPESFTLMESIMVVCMVVLGGMGNIAGVILGAALLTITPELLRAIINPLQRELFGRMVVDPENLRMLLFGLALIVVMLFRPAGLWPSSRRKEELSHD